MSFQRQQDFEEADRIRPDLSGYQDRVVGQGVEAVIERDRDLVVEAPTGAGKTAILAKLAQKLIERRGAGKVLILTHRKNLLQAMAGDPENPNLKKRLGEIAFWSGQECGTIAERKLGGVDQDPDIVAAMVVTASNLEDLEDYTDILIDETHHASAESADREFAGAYADIIAKCANARVVGVTATAFRGDEDKLHPRLEAAERVVVGVEETQQEKRTVRIETHVSKVRLANGMTPSEIFEKEASGELDRSASATIKDLKDDDYYRACLDESKAIIGDGRTIVFCDDVDEVKDVTRLLKEKFGENAAGMIFGSQEDALNKEAMSAYAAGDVQFLVSCQMIGEGYYVPETDSVLSFNSSLKRGQMNQFGGRCVRYADGRTHGKYIDCGTGTARYGALEEQHRIQTVRAMAFSGEQKAELQALARASANQQGDWKVVPGEKRTLFFRRDEDDLYRGYEIVHDAMREDGRRASRDADRGRKFRPLTDRDGLRAMSTRTLAGIVGEHVQDEAGFIARAGGLRGDDYKQVGRAALASWEDELNKQGKEAIPIQGGKLREGHIRAAVRGDRQYRVGLRATMTTLSEAKNKEAALNEGLRLSGAALDELAKSSHAPLGEVDNIKKLAKFVGEGKAQKLDAQSAISLSATVGVALSALSESGVPKPTSEVLSGLSGLVTGVSQGLREKESARKARGAAQAD